MLVGTVEGHGRTALLALAIAWCAWACTMDTTPIAFEGNGGNARARSGVLPVPGDPGAAGAAAPVAPTPPVSEPADDGAGAAEPVAEDREPASEGAPADDPPPATEEPVAADDPPPEPADPDPVEPPPDPVDPVEPPAAPPDPVEPPPEPEVLPRCVRATGDVVLDAPIAVGSGEVFDGGCQRFRAAWPGGGEDPDPLFRLEDGARLINVMLGTPTADGIHAHGDALLENVVWERVGDDALTLREEGTVTIAGGSAAYGTNTIFQINAPGTLHVTDFVAHDADKLVRQNGGTTFRAEVILERCDIARMAEAIFRTDSNTSTVTMRDSRYSRIGEALFMGVNPLNVTLSGNVEY